jgi:quercetin dioxygenase-like cupin family protein
MEIARSDQQVDNHRSRVTRYRLAPGAATGPHRHAFDYVIVPVTSGRLRVVGADGQVVHADLTAGVSYFRSAGVEHDVFNAGTQELVFVEVEFI